MGPPADAIYPSGRSLEPAETGHEALLVSTSPRRDNRPLAETFETTELLRAVNDSIADVGWNLREGDTLSFICECGVRGCIETVELTIAEYFDLGDQGPIVKAGYYHS